MIPCSTCEKPQMGTWKWNWQEQIVELADGYLSHLTEGKKSPKLHEQDTQTGQLYLGTPHKAMEDFGFFMWKACMNSTTTGEWPQNSHTHSSIIHYNISSKHMVGEEEICKMKTLEG